MENKTPGCLRLDTVIMEFEGGGGRHADFTGVHTPDVEPLGATCRPVGLPPGMLQGISPLVLLVILKDSKAKADILSESDTPEGDFIMPVKIDEVHHTLADWDFEQGSQYRTLSAAKFVSAPTSLRMGYAPGLWRNAILCRIPSTLVLPQGEVRTWVNVNFGSPRPAIFRNQTTPGTSNWLNCYYITVTPTLIYLYRSLAGVPSVRDSTSTYRVANQWVHYRVFWYNGKTPGDAEALCVDVYVEIAGEWTKIGTTLYCTLNSWKDSDKNRCGIFIELAGGHLWYYDDTEIWGPV